MTDLERHLAELGIIPRPKPKPQPPADRPEGPPNTWKGVWYRDGNIPH